MTSQNRYDKERRNRGTFRKKNLVDPEFENIVKEFEKGNFPGPPAIKVYKHPIKKRTVIVSKGQQRSLRHGM